MLNGITNVADAQSLLQNSESQEIYGTSYEDAINTTVRIGSLAVLSAGTVYAGTTVVRNVGGYSLASVIPEITTAAGTAGKWLVTPKAVLVKVGTTLSTGTVGVFVKGVLWAVGVAIASALGLKIGSLTYNWIEENRPDAWVWLDEQLTAIGWRDFDFAIAENGLSYLPTAVVQLYRDWFDYLGFITDTPLVGTVERQTSIPTATEFSNFNFLDVTAFSDLPVIEPIAGFNYRTNQYLAMQKVYKLFEETYGYPVPANAYVFCQARRFEPRTDMMTVWIMENITSINFGNVSGVDNAYERFSDGTLSINVGANFNFANANGISTRFTVEGIRSSESGKVEIYNHQTNLTTATIPSAYRESTMTSAKLCQDNLGITIPTYGGVEVQSGATLPQLGETLEDTFPAWYENKLSISTPNATVDFLPVAIPQTNPLVEDTVLSQTLAQTGVIDITKPWVESELEVGSNSAVQELVDAGVNVQANPPMTPIGNSPVNPVTPLDGAGMISVYNPTIKQVNEFSEFLWSGFDIDTFKKLLSDPMDGIVAFFKLYATPSTSDVVDNISVGYINTGVQSKRVNDQFVYIDCGNIRPYQYYGNILDFEPYTSVKMYLPFIGIVPVSANHVITKNVNVKYKIDVLTGACCSLIYCDGVLQYIFNGNCAVQVPLTGINFQRTIASLINVGVGIGTLVSSKGTLGVGRTARAIAGGIGSANFQQSGSLGSNAGVLAPRIPYLLIERPKSYDAVEYPKYYGIPSNKTVKIRNLKGYTRVKEIHAHNIECTDEELKLIEETLRGGFII